MSDSNPLKLLFGLPRRVVARTFAFLSNAGVVEPLVSLCTRAIQVHTSGDDGAVTILTINSGRFRGDLEYLAGTGKFRILIVPFEWQGRVYRYFYGPGVKVTDAGTHPEIRKQQLRSRAFLRKFLKKLYSRLNVDAVIGASFLYIQDYDWGAVSHEIGVPYLVFMREGNVASAAICNDYAEEGKRLGKFNGTFLVLQNELQRSLLIESGFVNASNTAAAGIIRMDDLVNKNEHRSPERHADEVKRVAFFSFGPGTGILNAYPPNWPRDREKYLYRFCRQTHTAVAEFAAENPEVEVVFKPKWAGNWPERIRELVSSDGIDLDSLPNVSMEPNIDAHELILNSDVVIGYGSTVLLEAALFGLPVILPLFAEITEPRWQDHVIYADDLDCFDIADSPAALKKLISKRLRSPAVSPEIQQLRHRTFEKYVSVLDGRATERYSDIILSQVRLSQEASKST